MARLMLLALLLVALAGCATEAAFREIMLPWKGQSEKFFVEQQGAPLDVYEGANGERILIYSRSGGPQTRNTVAVYSGDWCKIQFFICHDGLIEKVRWEGSDCKATPLFMRRGSGAPGARSWDRWEIRPIQE